MGTTCVLWKFPLLDLSVIYVKKYINSDLIGLCCLVFVDGRVLSNPFDLPPCFMGFQKQNQSYFIYQCKLLIIPLNLVKGLLL